MSGDRRRSLRTGAVTSVAALALVLLAFNPDPKLLASGVYRFGDTETLATANMLYYKDGKTASIALSQHENGALIVSTNGKSDAAIQADRSKSYAADEITMTMLGSVGLAYKPDAIRVANVGLGSGMTTHVLLANDAIASVDTIEIEPFMVEASKAFGGYVSRAYEDPRSNIVIEDAKTYFSLHNSVYDLIIAEPSNPWVSGVASLFSTEFYERITAHLEDDGVFVQWIQLYEFNDDLAISILKALSEHFSDFVIYAIDDGNILLVARNKGLLGEPEWSALFESPIAAELAKVEIHSHSDLQVRQVATRSVLRAYLQSQTVPTNSDYYPYVDLNAGQARFAQTKAQMFPSWLLAPVPMLEMLSGERLDFDVVTRTNYLNRLVHISTAEWLYGWIVDGEGENAESDDLNLLATWLHEAAGYCGDDFDLNRWFSYVQDLMSASLPYMSTENGIKLINAVDRSECEGQQFPLIVSWFELYRAVAGRDAAAMTQKGRKLIEIMPANAPGVYRSYLLDVAMLGDISREDYVNARDIWEEYGPSMYSEEPLPGYMQLLTAIAAGTQPKN